MVCDVKMGGPPWLGPRRGCSLIHVTTPTRLWPSGPQQADRLEPGYASITLEVLGGLHVNSENYFYFENVYNPLKTIIVTIIYTIHHILHHKM